MSGVLLATSSVAFEQKVRKAMRGQMDGGITRWENDLLLDNPHAAVKEIMEFAPDAVVLGPNIKLAEALDLAAAFEAFHPEVELILVAEGNNGLFAKAMRAGISDLLPPQVDTAQLKESLDRALDTAVRRRMNVMENLGASGGVTGRGKVITVVAPKGGSGKTTLATNVAVGLAMDPTDRVVIVDLDLQFGDVGDSLQIQGEHTIADLRQVPGGLTRTNLKVFLANRGPNLFALCAPIGPGDADNVTPADVEEVVRLLSSEFDYVVIDTPAGITDATLTAVEFSSEILLVCDLSVASVRGLRKVADVLDRLGITEPKRRFVLNRADSRVGVSPDEAAAVMGMPVSTAIPSTRDLPMSMNQGTPIIEAAPRLAVSRKLMSLVYSLSGKPEPANGLKAAFSRMRSVDEA
ncbi:MAG: AAA family ATPase [Acidimicrobiia bacterium]|nr:AAA family ATPase [Acidimicrobiia bacterium]